MPPSIGGWGRQGRGRAHWRRQAAAVAAVALSLAATYLAAAGPPSLVDVQIAVGYRGHEQQVGQRV